METRIRLLATDYDGTAVTLYGSRDDMLSTSLIQHAINNNYTAFYGITHRCYATAGFIKPLAHIKTWHSNYSVEEIQNNITTIKITEHFAEATQLPCLGVSMLDDAVNQFDYTYENMIKPYELTGKITDAESQYIPIYKIAAYGVSKNNQL